MIDKVEDISGLNTVLELTKTYPFVYLQILQLKS